VLLVLTRVLAAKYFLLLCFIMCNAAEIFFRWIARRFERKFFLPSRSLPVSEEAKRFGSTGAYSGGPE